MKPTASSQPPMQPLRKTVALPILGEEVVVPITMDHLQVVEQAYDASCESVAFAMSHPGFIKRFKIAEVIIGWLNLTPEIWDKKGWTTEQVREDVMTAPAMGRMQKLIGCIQGSVLYTLKYLTEDDFKRLTKGEGIEGNVLSPETGEPLEPSEAAPPSSPTATPSPADPETSEAGA